MYKFQILCRTQKTNIFQSGRYSPLKTQKNVGHGYNILL